MDERRGRPISSFNELSASEARTAIDAIQKHLPAELLWTKRPKRRTARAYGTAGRRGRVEKEVQLVDPETLHLLSILTAKLGWTPERFDAFLHGKSSPVRSGAIRTLAEANRAIWALKGMLRHKDNSGKRKAQRCAAPCEIMNPKSANGGQDPTAPSKRSNGENVFQAIVDILVRRGMASSTDEAAAMIEAGAVRTQRGIVTNPEEQFRYNEPLKFNFPCRVLPFAVRPRGEKNDGTDSGKCVSRILPFPAERDLGEGEVTQDDIIDVEVARCEAAELEQEIALKLSRGGKVERGLEAAELLPSRDVDGNVVLKLVFREIGETGHGSFARVPPEAPRNSADTVTQGQLHEARLAHVKAAELEQKITLKLSRGAAVEIGLETAKLVPARDVDGSMVLKLIIQPFSKTSEIVQKW